MDRQRKKPSSIENRGLLLDVKISMFNLRFFREIKNQLTSPFLILTPLQLLIKKSLSLRLIDLGF